MAEDHVQVLAHSINEERKQGVPVIWIPCCLPTGSCMARWRIGVRLSRFEGLLHTACETDVRRSLTLTDREKVCERERECRIPTFPLSGKQCTREVCDHFLDFLRGIVRKIPGASFQNHGAREMAVLARTCRRHWNTIVRAHTSATFCLWTLVKDTTTSCSSSSEARPSPDF